MRDLPILFCILCFWFLLGILSYSINQDTTLTGGGLNTNNTFVVSVSGQNIYENTSSSDSSIPLFEPSTESKTKSVLSIIGTLFTFGISDIPGVPFLISLFISFLNTVLFIFVVVIVYRLIRSGGG